MEDLGRVGFFYNFIYSFILGCPGSLLLRLGFLGCSPLLTRASHCDAFSCCRAWALGRTWASAVVGHGLQSTDSIAVLPCGILPDQGSTPCLLLRLVDY